jgi:hypothetical protein|tara:strand:+ start:113 stop:1192 length:1080 start_codon:yes stop_codon:yes gene_type:complete
MKKLLLILLFLPMIVSAQGPEITSWILNLNGATNPSYPNYLTNVQDICYTSTDVYISCTCIPGYDIGPWAGNPNNPANQNFVFKINFNPQENTGNKTKAPMGHIGVWTNGVSVFNAEDGMSYQNQGIWNQNALYFEGSSFDNCLGHPAPNGEYHHHVNPTCLYDDSDNQNHSPIIGYAFDNFPIYGAYGYANVNGTGAIKRIESSYQEKNISNRSNGPSLNQYPLGAYIEDFEYVAGSGDLDEYNGRFCVTPAYPNGIYAYFVTIDANLDPVYPHTPGPYYYGIAQGSGNLGPQSGHHTIPANCTPFTGPTSIADEDYGIKSNLLHIVDIFGKNTERLPNNLQLYIYEDGTVEKKVIIE